jgi:hypothetical protein
MTVSFEMSTPRSPNMLIDEPSTVPDPGLHVCFGFVAVTAVSLSPTRWIVVGWLSSGSLHTPSKRAMFDRGSALECGAAATFTGCGGSLLAPVAARGDEGRAFSNAAPRSTPAPAGDGDEAPAGDGDEGLALPNAAPRSTPAPAGDGDEAPAGDGDEAPAGDGDEGLAFPSAAPRSTPVPAGVVGCLGSALPALGSALGFRLHSAPLFHTISMPLSEMEPRSPNISIDEPLTVPLAGLHGCTAFVAVTSPTLPDTGAMVVSSPRSNQSPSQSSTEPAFQFSRSSQ